MRKSELKNGNSIKMSNTERGIQKMTQEEFVKSIHELGVKQATSGLIGLLTSPPGRAPNPDIVKLSQWYNNLALEDRHAVNKIINEACHATVFNILAVFDGSATVEAGRVGSSFEVYYKGESGQVLLNDFYSENLTDLLNNVPRLP